MRIRWRKRRDGFLVPAQAVSVPLKFQREGIRYDELSEDANWLMPRKPRRRGR
jgi:type I site-specific restriction endonuclease